MDASSAESNIDRDAAVPSSARAAAAKKRLRRFAWWLALAVFVFAFGFLPSALAGGSAGGGSVVTVVLAAIIVAAVMRPITRRTQLANEQAARDAGGLWGGFVLAQPPNRGIGQRERTLFSSWTPSYWRTLARGTLRVFPGRLVFEPGKPGPNRPTVTITPAEVASAGAAQFGGHGILEVHLHDGNRRRFQLFGPPGSLNDDLVEAGFPVS